MKKSKKVTSYDSISPKLILLSALIGLATFVLSLWEFSTSALIQKELVQHVHFRVSIPLTIALIVGHVPILIRERQILKEQRLLYESVIFLFDSLSTGLRTGLNLEESFRVALTRLPSSLLKTRLQSLIQYMESGKDFRLSVAEVVQGLPKLVSEPMLCLVPAYESGGMAKELISNIAEFTRKVVFFIRNKKSSLSAYFYIALVSIAVFDASGVFLLYLIKIFSSLNTKGGFLAIQISFPTACFYIYVMGMIVVLFTSLFISKITREKVKFYADYLIVLLLVHLVVLGIVPIIFI